jgi:glycosyltransferase involved in cell wall biosynthesis
MGYSPSSGIADTPKVSVILPTYNRGYCLARAIDSVVQQTYVEWELIIVDNFSTDDTDKIIFGYKDKRIRYYKVQNNGVVAVSRNAAIRKSRADVIAFLDSDDWWDPEKLINSMKEIEGGVDVVYHDLVIPRNVLCGRFRFNLRLRTRALNAPVFDDLLFRKNALINSSVVVRKDLIERAGYIPENPNLVGGEDYLTWIEIARHTDHFHRLPQPMGYAAQGADRLSSPNKSIKYVKCILAIHKTEFARRGFVPPWIYMSLSKHSLRIGYYSDFIWYGLKVVLSFLTMAVKGLWKSSSK